VGDQAAGYRENGISGGDEYRIKNVEGIFDLRFSLNGKGNLLGPWLRHSGMQSRLLHKKW
jgi:hypothetical protein